MVFIRSKRETIIEKYTFCVSLRFIKIFKVSDNWSKKEKENKNVTVHKYRMIIHNYFLINISNYRSVIDRKHISIEFRRLKFT